MRPRWHARSGLLATLACLVVWVIGCGGDGMSQPPSTPIPTAGSTSLPATSSTSSSPLPSSSSSSEPVPSTPPTSAAPSTSPPASTTPGDAVAACVGSWPLRDRIALLVWPAAYSNQWADVEATVRDLHIGGVVLMKPDDDFALHLGEHIADVDAVSAHGLLVATDEEGGQVQRLAVLGPLPSQEAMSSESVETITATIGAHAQVLAANGVDVIFGPVVDVRPETGRDPLGHQRLFVGDPERVGELAAAYVDGWRSAGLLPVLKHFPGHGSASADSHTGAATTPPLAQLLQRDLVPYERLTGSGAGVMVGHLTVPDLTGGVPASQSPAALALLRDQLGYPDAVVFSDALGMAAVGAPVPEAAVRAIRAGIDVVVFTSLADTAGVIDAIEQAVASGDLGVDEVDDSAVRVARLEAEHGTQCVPASS